MNPHPLTVTLVKVAGGWIVRGGYETVRAVSFEALSPVTFSTSDDAIFQTQFHDEFMEIVKQGMISQGYKVTTDYSQTP